MIKCKYSSITKCTECKYVEYRLCKKFRIQHNNFLIRELIPFNYSSLKNIPKKNMVSFSRNVDVAKSAAAFMAVRLNKKVTKYTINQAITLMLSAEEFYSSVVYVDCSKILQDNEKVESVLQSFIDKCLMDGSNIVVFLGKSNVLPSNDWFKL